MRNKWEGYWGVDISICWVIVVIISQMEMIDNPWLCLNINNITHLALHHQPSLELVLRYLVMDLQEGQCVCKRNSLGKESEILRKRIHTGVDISLNNLWLIWTNRVVNLNNRCKQINLFYRLMKLKTNFIKIMDNSQQQWENLR